MVAPSRTESEASGSTPPSPAAPIVVLPGVDPAEEAKRLRQLASSCVLGYGMAKFDGQSFKFLFGVHNHRPRKTSEVNAIFASFRKHGVRRVDPDTTIPVFVSKGRILYLALSLDDDLPWLELAEGDDEPIVVASGQHRTGALDDLAVAIRKDLAAVTKGIQNLEAKKKHSSAQKKSLAAKRLEQQTLEQKLNEVHDWAIIAYDYDEAKKHEGLPEYISRNKILYDYQETNEEVMVTLLKRLDKDWGTERYPFALELTQKLASESDKKLARVFQIDATRFLATYLFRSGEYFHKLDEFSVVWLNKVSGVHAMILAYLVGMGGGTYAHLANTELFPSADEVAQIIFRFNSLTPEDRKNPKHPDCIALDVLDAKMRTMANDTTVFDDLMEPFDIAARTHLTRMELMGGTSALWLGILDEYKDAIKASFTERYSNELVGDSRRAVYLRGVLGRIECRLTPIKGTQPSPIPLLTQHTLCGMHEALQYFPRSLAEVSSYVEPLYPYHRAMTKSTRFTDTTSAMAVNIHRNDREKGVMTKFKQLGKLLWDSRESALLPMEIRFNLPEWDPYFELRTSLKKDDVVKHFESKTTTEIVDGSKVITELPRPSLLQEYGLPDTDRAAEDLFQAMTRKAPPSPADGPLGWRALQASVWKVDAAASKAKLRDANKVLRPAIFETVLVNHFRPRSMWPETVALREKLKATITKINPHPLPPFEFWDGIDTVVPTDIDEVPPDEMWAFLQHQRAYGDSLRAITKLVATIENHPLAKLGSDDPTVAEEIALGVDTVIKGFFINSTRRRFRESREDDGALFPLDSVSYVDIPRAPRRADDNTVASFDDDPQPHATGSSPSIPQEAGHSRTKEPSHALLPAFDIRPNFPSTRNTTSSAAKPPRIASTRSGSSSSSSSVLSESPPPIMSTRSAPSRSSFSFVRQNPPHIASARYVAESSSTHLVVPPATHIASARYVSNRPSASSSPNIPQTAPEDVLMHSPEPIRRPQRTPEKTPRGLHPPSFRDVNVTPTQRGRASSSAHQFASPPSPFAPASRSRSRSEESHTYHGDNSGSVDAADMDWESSLDDNVGDDSLNALLLEELSRPSPTQPRRPTPTWAVSPIVRKTKRRRVVLDEDDEEILTSGHSDSNSTDQDTSAALAELSVVREEPPPKPRRASKASTSKAPALFVDVARKQKMKQAQVAARVAAQPPPPRRPATRSTTAASTSEGFNRASLKPVAPPVQEAQPASLPGKSGKQPSNPSAKVPSKPPPKEPSKQPVKVTGIQPTKKQTIQEMIPELDSDPEPEPEVMEEEDGEVSFC